MGYWRKASSALLVLQDFQHLTHRRNDWRLATPTFAVQKLLYLARDGARTRRRGGVANRQSRRLTELMVWFRRMIERQNVLVP
jgi:hypothetical protein